MQAVMNLLIRSSQRRAVLGGLRDGASQPVAAGTPAASLHPPRRVRPLGLQGECSGRCVEGRAMMARDVHIHCPERATAVCCLPSPQSQVPGQVCKGSSRKQRLR